MLVIRDSEARELSVDVRDDEFEIVVVEDGRPSRVVVSSYELAAFVSYVMSSHGSRIAASRLQQMLGGEDDE
jgi:hypothetical protein